MFTQKFQWIAVSCVLQFALIGCQSDYLDSNVETTEVDSDSTPSNSTASADTETESAFNNGNTDTQTDSNTDDTDPREGTITSYLIDNFDDSDDRNELDGIWITYDDQYDGGNSIVVPTSYYNNGIFYSEAPGYGETGYAFHMSGTTGGVFGWDYLGVFAATGADTICPIVQNPTQDFTQYNGIQFMAKGTTVPSGLHFKLPYKKTGADDNCTHDVLAADSLTNYNDFEYDFGAKITDEWQLIRIPFDEMERGSNPEGLTIEEVLATAKELIWEYQKSNGEVDLWIDDIAFYTISK
ncbi:MAG: hypothetical protein JXX29_18880 [Deltaproteobacteria bacterium]|nr:hypothetical protein [Deltaproteobacteria bacterium]MBN2673751.1 hypothetical protein [Deltaproteobacteria bacterium]